MRHADRFWRPPPSVASPSIRDGVGAREPPRSACCAAAFLTTRPTLLDTYASADLLDADLDHVVAELVALVAQNHHLTLVGVADCLLAERDRLRAKVRADLEWVGRQAAEAEDRARQLTGTRTGLLAQVLAWEDPAEFGKDGNLRETTLAEAAGRRPPAGSGNTARRGDHGSGGWPWFALRARPHQRLAKGAMRLLVGDRRRQNDHGRTKLSRVPPPRLSGVVEQTCWSMAWSAVRHVRHVGDPHRGYWSRPSPAQLAAMMRWLVDEPLPRADLQKTVSGRNSFR